MLRTRNSLPGGALDQTAFTRDYCALTADAAAWLVEQGIRLFGIDYYSVEPMGSGAPVHKALLGAGAALLEGLDLRHVEPGPYTLAALPLRLRGFDGSPARAVLTRE